MTTLCKCGATSFFVIHSGVTILAVYVALVTLHSKRNAIEHHASVINAAVAVSRNAEITFEFEVFYLATLPGDETIFAEQRGRCYFSNEVAVFHAPVNGIAAPAFKILSIEDGYEVILILWR